MGVVFVLVVTMLIAVLAPWFGVDSRERPDAGNLRW